MRDADAAGAILNTRRRLILTDESVLLMRRLKMRELIEQSERVGGNIATTLAAMPKTAHMTEMVIPILRAMGDPVFDMFALILEREGSEIPLTPTEVGDFDVEDFATLLEVFVDIHKKAIETFRRAFASIEAGGKKPGRAGVTGSLSSEPSTGSSGPGMGSETSPTSPSTAS